MKINNPNFDTSSETIQDFIDDAILIISNWRKLNGDMTELLEGRYDDKIIKYVLEAYNMLGNEGQATDNSLGVGKTFRNSPEGNLKSSIPQRL